MRGNPLGQLVLIVIAFALLGVPVWRLTRAATVAPATGTKMSGRDVQIPYSTSAASGPMTLELTADFAPAAAEFSLNYLDQTVLQGKAQGTGTAQWKIQLPAEGTDLVLHVVWPPEAAAGGAAAARVSVRFPDGRTIEKSFWSPSAAALDTVISVPGNGEAKPEQP